MGPDHEPTPVGADLKENYVLPVKKHRHRKKGVSDSSDTNASDEKSDFSRSANQFHEFPDVGVKTDVNSENDDNLALHGITLEPEPSFPKFNLRENILDLDRDKFLQEILSMKRRAKDRTYPRQEQPKKMFQTDHIKVQDITKMLERKKKLKDPSRLERRAQRDAMNITPEHFKHLNKRGADDDDDYFDDYNEDWRNESHRDEFEDYR